MKTKAKIVETAIAELAKEQDRHTGTLDRIAELFVKARRNYREDMLEVGRLCHEYILAKRAEGLDRYVAVFMISQKLKDAGFEGSRPDIGRWTAIYWVVQLLGDGDPGPLPLATLREFYPVLKRDRKTETYSIRPEYEKQARKIFAKAVAGVWRKKDVQGHFVKVSRMGGSLEKRQASREDKPFIQPDNPIIATHHANPRDLADLVVGMIARNGECEVVVDCMLRDSRFTSLLPENRKKFRRA